MAPEFFPFIAFFGLSILVLIGLFLGVIFLIAAFFSSRSRRFWRKIAIVTFGGTLLVVLMLLLLGRIIRQQFFLNEPFVSACANGNLQQAEELLSRGASVNAYGIDYNETALIGSTKNGQVEVVDFLLFHGADPRLQDSKGKTARQYALELGKKDIVATLEQYEGK